MKIADVDGVEVFQDGDRGPVVLMLHGWPDTRSLWDDQVAALSARYRCVRFTLPGFEPHAARPEHFAFTICVTRWTVTVARLTTKKPRPWVNHRRWTD